LLLLATALWVALEVHTHGFDGAFGGALASSESVTRSRHAAGAFQRAWDRTGDRTEQALEGPDN
jgi:hypothetical protein